MSVPPECPRCISRTNVRPAPTGRGAFLCTTCGAQFRPEDVGGGGTYKYSTRRRSDRQEGHNARRVEGRVTVNSGAGRDKGDVKVSGLLREEDKTTEKASYVLKLADLRKVAAAARGDEIPIMRIAFEDDLRQQYVVLPSDWFQQLLTAYRENR